MTTTGMFIPTILHPNVFPSGTVSLSLIEKEKGWKPQVTMKQVSTEGFDLTAAALQGKTIY
jgi:ubiquitin-protein ligase